MFNRYRKSPQRDVPQSGAPLVPEKDTWVEVPSNYMASARWTPGIGEYFPNFSGRSTEGRITFHPYANGNWTIFFSIAAAFSDTCTRELTLATQANQRLRDEGVNLIGVAKNSLRDLVDWCDSISDLAGCEMDIPIISDPEGLLTETFGMIHPLEADTSAIRKTIIIDPTLRVSMLFEYPLYISRSMDEVLRALDAARDFYAAQKRRAGRGQMIEG